MLNVTEQTKSAYSGNSINKTLTITVPSRNITFTNADLVSQSMELTEAIETERNLTFKGCIASQFKFQAANIVTDLRGEYIEAKIQAGETEEIPLFKGYIDEQNNLTHEDVITEFICYDVLYKKGDIECIEWYESLSFPLSVKSFRDSFFNFIGITQKEDTLINDSLMMQKTVSSNSSIKSRYIMECICQANARYGKIGRDGRFEYVKLETAEVDFGTYPSTETYPSPTTYPARPTGIIAITSSLYRNLDYNPHYREKITKVVVWDEAEVVQGEAGDGDNVFKISGNMVAFSLNLNSCARNIYNEIKDIRCKGARIDLVGLPYAETGDIYKSSTRRNLITSYILNRTLTGIQALSDNYSSTLDQYQTESDTLSNQILKLSGKTNVLTRTVDETISELTEFERTTNGTLRDQSTKIQQTAQSIESVASSVESLGGVVREQTSTIEQLSGSVTTTVKKVNDIEGTVEEQSSVIQQTAASVNSKVTKGQVSSEISQEAGAITIRANRISIESTYFKLSSNGTIEASNGKFSGEIVASSGTIGGFTIGQKALYNGMTTLDALTSGVYLGTDGIAVSWGSGYGFIVKKSGNVTIKPLGANAMKIGLNASFDSSGNLSVGGTYGGSITSSAISVGGLYGFKATSSNVTLGSQIKLTSTQLSLPSSFEIKNTYSSIKFGSTLEVGYMSRVSIGSSGKSIGFFGNSGNTQQYVSTLYSSASLSDVISKVNDLLRALKGYGLIRT